MPPNAMPRTDIPAPEHPGIEPRDIEALIESFEASDWTELHVEIEGLSLFLSRDPASRGPASAAAASAVPAAPPSAAPLQAAADPAPPAAGEAVPRDGLVAIRAPNLGSFYRAPKPGAPPYVEVGHEVTPDTEICLIEVMKLFTSVKAGVSGIVRQVLVEDAALVEFDQPLMLIEPKG